MGVEAARIRQLLGRCGLVQKGGPAASDFELSIPVWQEILSDFDVAAIASAFSEHLSRSRFYPTPADIIDIIGGSATRLPERDDAELSRLTGYPLEDGDE